MSKTIHPRSKAPSAPPVALVEERGQPHAFSQEQIAFLKDVLCPDPVQATLALAEADEEPGHGGGGGSGGEGCNDDGPDATPCSNDPWIGTNKADTKTTSQDERHLQGGNGDDILKGIGGRDCLEGGNGNDRLDGGPGRDFLYGGNGNDELRGGKGRDDMFGGNGNDLLIGGCGPDLMDGGNGNDVLFGGNAPDTMTGGRGRDVFVLALPGGEEGEGGGGHDGGSGGGGGHGEETTTLLAPAAHEGEGGEDPCTEGLDVVTDFKQGTDLLALGGGLTLDQIDWMYDETCSGILLFVISGHDHEEPTLATTAEEGDDHGGRRLAFLAGFSGTLSEQDFLTCADLGLQAV